jgi:hypothetical protein
MTEDDQVKHGTVVRWPEAYGYLAIGLAYLAFFAFALSKKT